MLVLVVLSSSMCGSLGGVKPGKVSSSIGDVDAVGTDDADEEHAAAVVCATSTALVSRCFSGVFLVLYFSSSPSLLPSEKVYTHSLLLPVSLFSVVVAASGASICGSDCTIASSVVTGEIFRSTASRGSLLFMLRTIRAMLLCRQHSFVVVGETLECYMSRAYYRKHKSNGRQRLFSVYHNHNLGKRVQRKDHC